VTAPFVAASATMSAHQSLPARWGLPWLPISWRLLDDSLISLPWILSSVHAEAHQQPALLPLRTLRPQYISCSPSSSRLATGPSILNDERAHALCHLCPSCHFRGNAQIVHAPVCDEPQVPRRSLRLAGWPAAKPISRAPRGMSAALPRLWFFWASGFGIACSRYRHARVDAPRHHRLDVGARPVARRRRILLPLCRHALPPRGARSTPRPPARRAVPRSVFIRSSGFAPRGSYPHGAPPSMDMLQTVGALPSSCSR